jgi:cell division transport system permease protein
VNFLQALRSFFREAFINLVRGWKVSLLAVLTIAVSLLVGGGFLLVSRNLLASVERWRGEMRVVVYLQPSASAAVLARLSDEARRLPWADKVETVSAEVARERFQGAFPSLSDLVEGMGDEPLPASIEISLRDPSRRPADLHEWLDTWRRRPEVSMVDDDREWLGQLETVVAVVRAVGLALSAGLLGAAIFTIASVIRLTAWLHHEETSVLRLVGATEFYIRGPFYAEGLLQGLLGGLLAAGGLWAAWRLVRLHNPGSLMATLLLGDFLSAPQLALLIALGGTAGLVGAVASLRREAL